tara:strand:- start:15566 stop:15913 length:348 start_codon:yes stop_codon:yes gene_type:complete
MADIDFPSLPSPVGGQFSEGFLETKVQDQGEVGSPRQRNRFTRGLARFSFQMLLTGAQRSALAAFYDVTLVRGVNRFNWTHPTTAVVYEAIMPSRPSIKHMTADLWTADVEIEEV